MRLTGLNSVPYPPILAYGFRPFFLLAGIYAVLTVPIWVITLHGHDLSMMWLPAQIWHAHEMIFGFIIAAVAGFLLTAIPSWTGRRGFAGAPLFGLVLIWIAGRVVMTITTSLGPLMVAIVDMAFIPALTVTILPALIRSGNRRNLFFIALLVSLFAANLHFHLSGSLLVAPLQFAINLILVLVTVVAGRVIPAFTSAGLRQLGSDVGIRRNQLLDRMLIVATIAVVVVDFITPGSVIEGTLAMVTAVLFTVQLVRWQGWRLRSQPILWILHLGYAWIPVAMLLKAIWLLGVPIPGTSWIHALTTGAYSTMILGIMSRASLGHTGRALIAPLTMVVGYYLLIAAGLGRVFGPILNLDHWRLWVSSAAILWCLSFLLFLFVFAPILCSRRADGRAG